MDGDPGEGEPFYRLEFHSNGLVTVLKQIGGNIIEEEKTWNINNKIITIENFSEDIIYDFNDAQLVLESL